MACQRSLVGEAAKRIAFERGDWEVATLLSRCFGVSGPANFTPLQLSSAGV